MSLEDVDGAGSGLTAEDQMMSLPYLLLDVRDRDAYEACHAITGNGPSL